MIRPVFRTEPYLGPVELGIGGLIDLAHAPLADEGGHVVMGDAVTDVHKKIL